MSKEDILEALRIHANEDDCCKCPYARARVERCTTQLAKDVLRLIKELIGW